MVLLLSQILAVEGAGEDRVAGEDEAVERAKMAWWGSICAQRPTDTQPRSLRRLPLDPAMGVATPLDVIGVLVANTQYSIFDIARLVTKIASG